MTLGFQRVLDENRHEHQRDLIRSDARMWLDAQADYAAVTPDEAQAGIRDEFGLSEAEAQAVYHEWATDI